MEGDDGAGLSIDVPGPLPGSAPTLETPAPTPTPSRLARGLDGRRRLHRTGPFATLSTGTAAWGTAFDDGDVTMTTASPGRDSPMADTRPTATERNKPGRITNAPALPAAPRYAGSTMKDRRVFMHAYETYFHALSAFDTGFGRPFIMPVSGCIEERTCKMICLEAHESLIIQSADQEFRAMAADLWWVGVLVAGIVVGVSIMASKWRASTCSSLSGLGLALAKKYVQKGAKVSIVARGLDKLEESKKEIEGVRKGSDQVFIQSCDVADFASVQKAVDAANKFHGRATDHVVCSAGFAAPGYFMEQDVSLFKKIMDVNYFGTLHTIKAALPAMVQRSEEGGEGGHIVL
ncbi:3-ketodihydrosphingosine reductase, partial [Phytophthora megakarya]